MWAESQAFASRDCMPGRRRSRCLLSARVHSFAVIRKVFTGCTQTRHFCQRVGKVDALISMVSCNEANRYCVGSAGPWIFSQSLSGQAVPSTPQVPVGLKQEEEICCATVNARL